MRPPGIKDWDIPMEDPEDDKESSKSSVGSSGGVSSTAGDVWWFCADSERGEGIDEEIGLLMQGSAGMVHSSTDLREDSREGSFRKGNSEG